MKYASPSAFRQALLSRLPQMAGELDTPAEYLRKRVVFERLLARHLTIARIGGYSKVPLPWISESEHIPEEPVMLIWLVPEIQLKSPMIS